MRLSEVKKTIRKQANPKKAKILQRFFKTGPGEYTEGDIFLGIQVPVIRKLSKQFEALEFDQTLELLKSPIHEERLLALLILILKYRASCDQEKSKIFQAYLKHTKYINNWDLVDLSAKQIIGEFLHERDRAILFTLAKSKLLWERRIAALATFYFIGKNDFRYSLRIAKILLKDKHDLMHKAVGWMLREVGKRDIQTEEFFLKRHYRQMPRTMLRYSIEKFSPSKRQAYLKGRIN